jgi:hypothetical protein
MAKLNKVAKVAPVANAAVQLYTLGVAPRGGLHAETKHGAGGTAGTYQAIVAALQAAGGAAPFSVVQAVCRENADPGFARYAVRSGWVKVQG